MARISKSLSNRKEKLKMADMLDGRCGGVKEELLIGALQTVKRGRVYAVRQIDPNGADRRPIADAKSGCVDHVIEVSNPVLVSTERNGTDAGIDIPHVMKEDTLHIVSGERKAQLGSVKEQAVASYWESGNRIARAGLVVGEAAHRSAAAAEEAFRQRDVIK